MRAASWILVAAIGVVLGAGSASAEKVRTNQTTKVTARPGEQAKVLVTVKSGQNMTLLKQDGRWLKVRVNGRTGYVPRSKVDMADDGGISRNTRRRPFVDGRSKKRGFGGDSPDDRVGADAVGDTGASSEDDSEDEEEEPAPKKPAKAPVTKAPAKVAAASKGKASEDEEDDEEDEEEEAPPPKKAAPPTKPVATKASATKAPAAKASDEEDDEESDEESDEEDSAPAKSAAKPASSDEDEESDEEDSSKKGDDEENPVKGEGEERAQARVSKKVSVYEEADAESNEEFVARPTDILYPMESKNGWTFVENAEGDSGWVQSDMLELEGGGAAGGGKRVIDIRARGGLTLIQQGLRTSGSNVLEVPDNYNIGTSSMTLSIGAGILIPKGKWLVGGELTYDYAKALGGGVFYDPDPNTPMDEAHIGITLHNVNVRALAGIDMKKKSGMTLFGRLGYRYQGFLVTDVTNFTANPARLPSEVVKAPTLGAALSLPRLTSKIGIKFALDAILFAASVKQTVGLEDGASPSVKAIVLGTDFTYHLKAFDIAAVYNLSYMSIDFGAPVATSMRNHMGTNVSRTDLFHQITFGIAKPF